MKLSNILIAVILVGFLTGCRDHNTGRIIVDGGSTPRFSFIGSDVSGLVVYRVPPEYLGKGIILDETRKDGPNVFWRLDEGKHDAAQPIIYGVVHAGAKAVVPAKPLQEDVVYFVSGYVGTRDTAAFLGQYFIVKDGHTQEFHGEGGESSNP